MISNPVLCVVCWSATSDVVSSNNAARDATPTRPDCLCSHTAPGHLRLQSVYKQKKAQCKGNSDWKGCGQKYFNIEEKKRGIFILVTSSTISVYRHLVSLHLDNFVSQKIIKIRIRTTPCPKMISSWSKHYSPYIWTLKVIQHASPCDFDLKTIQMPNYHVPQVKAKH